MPLYQDCSTLSVEELESRLSVSTHTGLSHERVLELQKKFGKNILHTNDVTVWHIFLRQFSSPFIFLLIGASVLSFGLGEKVDALFIFVFICINTTLGFWQEYRSENIIKALKNYLRSYAIVRRENKEVRVEKSELVPGDVVLLQAGDVVPADLRLLDAHSLEIDESILTGESESSLKIDDVQGTMPVEPYQAKNMCFSGTTVVSGRATAVVIATGSDTVFGNISKLATETTRESDFELGMKKVSKMILHIVGLTFIFLFLTKIFFHTQNDNLFEFLIFSIALAVSVIPEALPLVITFTLSYGAKRLAQNKVVVKRLSAIEDLGGIEILCTDKTGTITENKMRMAGLFAFEGSEEELLRCARLTSFSSSLRLASHPYDEALLNGITKQETDELAKYKRKDEIPFDPIRRRNCVIIENKNNFEIIVRGAPEEVIKLCPTADQAALEKCMQKEGAQGHRVLALASRVLGPGEEKDIYAAEKNLRFMGCVALYDPLKTSSLEAIDRAKQLGVQIKVLTGDAKEVAQAVAKQARIISANEGVITGAEFMAASPDERKALAEQFHVFARVSPEEKYEIIKTLEQKFTVGFLGEGFNDAPALKIAHVGMVVDNASDVAREAADIILLKQSLLVIVKGIEEGRRVFANNIKYLKSTLASNFGNFYAVVAASFIAPFLPLLPVQILLLNLLSDFPMMSIASDTVDTIELKSPRHYNIREIVRICLILGAVSTIFDFMFFGLFYRYGESTLQTNWFIGSVLTELVFLFSIRTHLPFWKAVPPSRMVLVLTFGAAFVAVALPFIPHVKEFFHFESPSLHYLSWTFGLIGTYLVVTEFVKLQYYKKFR